MNILVTAPYNAACLQQLKEEFGEVKYLSWKEHGREFSEDEILALLKECNADGLITELDEVTKKVIAGHPKLKFIGVCRANPVNVDVAAASGQGIPVFHTPARNAQAVAELFIGNVISFLRHTIPSTKWLAEKNWEGESFSAYLNFKGNELAGKTVGFVGFGAVPQKIANMIKHFPCSIQYYDPFVAVESVGYKQLALEEIFEQSDIVSIHLPVNDKTKGMISADLLKRMKKEAIFVNTARAVVVDNASLLELLKNNQIRGAILDVFDQEPPSEQDYELIQLPNVLATPHIAGASHEVEDHHSVIMNESLLKWAKHQSQQNIFNRKSLVPNK
ncbi:2-hydroxyacid dehydrogenase [Brevibacillus sp. B_LB10_24]|uniref:2-hydroxyacid dehydrogenase n=1 Tax=Brevibacillus sp. B_LB10_24 TaxID=3380645 RepID=UPI0038BAD7E8